MHRVQLRKIHLSASVSNLRVRKLVNRGQKIQEASIHGNYLQNDFNRMYKTPKFDKVREFSQMPGAKIENTDEQLYHRRLEAHKNGDYSQKNINEVKNSYTMEEALHSISSWEFQKRPWLVYGEKQLTYNQTPILFISFQWEDIVYELVDPMYEKYYPEGEDPKVIVKNEFLTNMHLGMNPVVKVTMTDLGYNEEDRQSDLHIEYGAGRFGSSLINQGYPPFVRVVINFMGQTTSQIPNVIKGLAGSGVQIVSISERTPDFETIRPKIKPADCAPSLENVGMWARLYRQRREMKQEKLDHLRTQEDLIKDTRAIITRTMSKPKIYRRDPKEMPRFFETYYHVAPVAIDEE